MCSVSELIRQAYVEFANGHLNNDVLARIPTIEGGPRWINSDGYQIDAKAEGAPGGDMLRGPAMQALLEERFKLKIRHESRDVPVYALAVAEGGPKLEPSKEGCRSLELNALQFCLGAPNGGEPGFRLKGVTMAELASFYHCGRTGQLLIKPVLREDLISHSQATQIAFKFLSRCARPCRNSGWISNRPKGRANSWSSIAWSGPRETDMQLTAEFIVNHLWQSSRFPCLLMALLAFVLAQEFTGRSAIGFG